MNSESQLQEIQIRQLLGELHSTYGDLTHLQVDIGFYNPNDQWRKELVTMQEDKFKHVARCLYAASLAYIEAKNLPAYLNMFFEQIDPYFADDDSMMIGNWSPAGDRYSVLANQFDKMFYAFPALSSESKGDLIRVTGLTYVENILASTAIIMRDLKIIPKSEIEVSNAVKIVCKATFPTAQFPTESFQQTAKCYKPDILIPSLGCAIEYKFAETQSRLIQTIDEILIDVKGYAQNRTYKIFYAVFYVKPGIWTNARFDAVWKEKQFPENWKGLLIQGL